MRISPRLSSSPVQTQAVRVLQWFARVCLLTAAAMLAWSGYFWFDGYMYQRMEAKRFDTYTSAARAPTKAVANAQPLLAPAIVKPANGALLGRLDIPSVGMSVMVFEGDDPRVLRRGAGHIEGTALPWQPGNTGIAAHRDTFFRALRGIHEQDEIEFSTPTKTQVYRVVSTKIVGPDDVAVLADTGQPALTLATCYPFYYVGPAPKRFIVRAERMPQQGESQ